MIMYSQLLFHVKMESSSKKCIDCRPKVFIFYLTNIRTWQKFQHGEEQILTTLNETL
jgi:hypothetical protein